MLRIPTLSAIMLIIQFVSGGEVSAKLPAREAMMTLLDSRWNSRDIAAKYDAQDLFAEAVWLASNQQGFERGAPGRLALVETILLASRKASGELFSQRAPVGDFLLSELVAGPPSIRIAILTAPIPSAGPYQGEICDFLVGYVSDADQVDDLPTLVQSLRVIGQVCGDRPGLDVTLRRFVLEGWNGVPASVIEKDIAGLRSQVSSAAATALLATHQDISGSLMWLRTLDQEAPTLAARQALSYGLGPGGRFDVLDLQTQEQWAAAWIEIANRTLPSRPLSSDEFALLASLGERHAGFRQTVGDFLEQCIAARMTDDSIARRARETLDRWARQP